MIVKSLTVLLTCITLSVLTVPVSASSKVFSRTINLELRRYTEGEIMYYYKLKSIVKNEFEEMVTEFKASKVFSSSTLEYLCYVTGVFYFTGITSTMNVSKDSFYKVHFNCMFFESFKPPYDSTEEWDVVNANVESYFSYLDGINRSYKADELYRAVMEPVPINFTDKRAQNLFQYVDIKRVIPAMVSNHVDFLKSYGLNSGLALDLPLLYRTQVYWTKPIIQGFDHPFNTGRDVADFLVSAYLQSLDETLEKVRGPDGISNLIDIKTEAFDVSSLNFVTTKFKSVKPRSLNTYFEILIHDDFKVHVDRYTGCKTNFKKNNIKKKKKFLQKKLDGLQCFYVLEPETYGSYDNRDFGDARNFVVLSAFFEVNYSFNFFINGVLRPTMVDLMYLHGEPSEALDLKRSDGLNSALSEKGEYRRLDPRYRNQEL